MTEGELCVRDAKPGYKHYLRVKCNRKLESVHLLVCRAFKGRPKPNEVSVDHKDRDDSNNRPTNLEWATLEQQARNQGDHKANSNGEPCLVWQVVGDKLKSKTTPYDTTPVKNTEQRFPSLNAAVKALGLYPGQLSPVLNGKRKTAVGTDGKRYTGELDPDLADIAEDEEWKEKKISSRNRLLLSNYGRLQWIWPGGVRAPYLGGRRRLPESQHRRPTQVRTHARRRALLHWPLSTRLGRVGPQGLGQAKQPHSQPPPGDRRGKKELGSAISTFGRRTTPTTGSGACRRVGRRAFTASHTRASTPCCTSAPTRMATSPRRLAATARRFVTR